MAAACGCLVHNEVVWNAVRARLLSFDLPVHVANRRQALFPEKSEPLRNHNGTAWGDGLRQLGVQLVGRPHSEYPLIDLAEQLTS